MAWRVERYVTPQHDRCGYIVIGACVALGTAIIMLLTSIVEREIASWSMPEAPPSRAGPSTVAEQSDPDAACAPAAEWGTADDYPLNAIMQDQEGTTTLSWMVGDNGRIASCRIAVSSGHHLLDQAGCRAIMARGCYDPKSLSHKREFTRRIVWRLPT
ncbi:TonB family protein [Sphingomonas sp. IC4-52]|uniref:TonB family protein n=1 Tax=Sphingomonas sp. IC4-52 TaxID=2887202 RepID=UPI001D118103|nr:TonB family protein [Sphingomonas sp. IC4-52]MCC2978856.1 energy transducer TonB [Sphingomonas sp. IC4-52]